MYFTHLVPPSPHSLALIFMEPCEQRTDREVAWQWQRLEALHKLGTSAWLVETRLHAKPRAQRDRHLFW